MACQQSWPRLRRGAVCCRVPLATSLSDAGRALRRPRRLDFGVVMPKDAYSMNLRLQLTRWAGENLDRHLECEAVAGFYDAGHGAPCLVALDGRPSVHTEAAADAVYGPKLPVRPIDGCWGVVWLSRTPRGAKTRGPEVKLSKEPAQSDVGSVIGVRMARWADTSGAALEEAGLDWGGLRPHRQGFLIGDPDPTWGKTRRSCSLDWVR